MSRQKSTNRKKAAGGITLQQPKILDRVATSTTQGESSRRAAQEQAKTTEQKFKDTVAAILSKYAADIGGEKRLILRRGANTEAGCLPLCDLWDAIWDSPRSGEETHKDQLICERFLNHFTVKWGKACWKEGLRIPGIDKRNYVSIGDILDSIILGAEERNARAFDRVISRTKRGAL